MDKSSPYYEFDPDSPAWLRRRSRNGEDVLAGDVARIVAANPDLIADPVLREYVIRGLRCELKARRGRKRGMARLLKEMYVLALYEDLLPRLTARRERQRRKGIRKRRGDYSPAECAQALIGRRVGMGTPEGVRNLISSLKNEPNSR